MPRLTSAPTISLSSSYLLIHNRVFRIVELNRRVHTHTAAKREPTTNYGDHQCVCNLRAIGDRQLEFSYPIDLVTHMTQQNIRNLANINIGPNGNICWRIERNKFNFTCVVTHAWTNFKISNKRLLLAPSFQDSFSPAKFLNYFKTSNPLNCSLQSTHILPRFLKSPT